MKVSAIVPVYNGARWLAEALQSIYDQDYHPLEVIVVDDGSTDASAAVAQTFPVRYLYQQNQGASSAYNAGAAASGGDVLTFLDADDRWQPDKLKLQISHLQAHPEVDLSYGYLRNFLDGTEPPRWLHQEHLAGLEPSFSACTLAVRRAAWDRVGPFATSFRVGEDTDWFIRARQAGLTMVQLPSIVLDRRVHDQNLSQAYDDGQQQMFMQLARAALARRRGTAGVPPAGPPGEQ